MEEFTGGLIIGALIAALLALYESDSANIYEYKYGEYVCQKNDGFQYFEKRMFNTYTFVCKDKASFAAISIDIKKVTGGWQDNDILEEKK